jgi:gluconokinase
LSWVIGLDLGTTHVKAMAMDEGGAAQAAAQAPLQLDSPHPGWAQQDAAAVAAAAVQVLRQVARQTDGSRVEAVALSGAMHSLAAVDEHDRALAAAMTWADARASAHVRPEFDGNCYADTGCPAHASYHPARLRWWHEQPQRQRVRRFVAIKDFVAFALCGRWATDRCLASSTGLLNLQGLWHEPALQAAHASADQLPPLVEPCDVLGTFTASAARDTGLAPGTRLIAGGSDGTLANLGAVGEASGRVVITVGTSGALRWNVAQPQLDAQQRTWCYRAPLTGWVAGGAINSAGLAVQWIAQRFYGEEADPLGALMQDAASVEPGAAGVILLPYFSGERAPHYRGDLTASLHGLTLRHERCHIARAAVESTALCLAQVWQALSPQTHEAWLTGGITRQPMWTQLLADVLGVALRPMTEMDASTRGAAVLGHAALGRSLPAPAAPPAVEPDAKRHARYREILAAFIAAQADTVSRR